MEYDIRWNSGSECWEIVDEHGYHAGFSETLQDALIRVEELNKGEQHENCK